MVMSIMGKPKEAKEMIGKGAMPIAVWRLKGVIWMIPNKT